MQSLLPISTAVSRTFLLTPRRTILPQLYYVSRRFFHWDKLAGMLESLLTPSLLKTQHTPVGPLERCC